MANANQVIVNGEIILDLRSDTVTPETLQKGYTAHDKSGTKITGTLEASSVPVQPSKSVTLTSNGAITVTPDAPYDALKKVDVTVNVASKGANVSYNTVEPNRYSVDFVDPDNQTAQLDLTGLVAGGHYICNMQFQGAALTSENLEPSGETLTYFMTVCSTGSEQHDGIVYSCSEFSVSAPIQYNSTPILNLDLLLNETAFLTQYHGMAYEITEMTQSIIVSWD